MKLPSVLKIIIGCLILLLPRFIYANEVTQEFYGTVKASINFTDDGNSNSIGVSSNSTRIGWKGKKKLDGDLQAYFQIEGEIDIAERSKTEFARRNSYVGIKGGFGEIFIGQHDTPIKRVRKALFGNSIADSRILLSVESGTSVATTNLSAATRLDDRVTNAIGYKTLKYYGGVQAFVLYSAASNAEAEATGNDDDSYDLLSASILYDTKKLYVGLGALDKSNGPGASKLRAIRLVANYKFGQFKVGGVYDVSRQGAGHKMTRDAKLIYGQYRVAKSTQLGLQISQVDDYDGSSNTGATNLSLGVETKLAEPTLLYAVYTMTNNEKNARYGLAQSGTRDKIQAADIGSNVSGFAIGISHSF